MLPTKKLIVGMFSTPLPRPRRRAMALVASAVLAVPISICGGAAVDQVADASPLHAPAPFGFPTDASPFGATGATPRDTQVWPDLLRDAGDPNALLAGAGPAADLPDGPLGIPGIVLQAYLRAQQVIASTQPSCRLSWWLLAGIGKVESNHAENGEVDAAGLTLRPILGPELNGTNGTAPIPATDGGRWTGDPRWTRAVGPMQFLPSTWLEYGAGGNPNNVFDAAIAAGRYLCAAGGDLSDPVRQALAVFNYNHSDSYVRLVLIWANAYRQNITPLPQTVVPAAAPGPAGGLPPSAPTGPEPATPSSRPTSTSPSTSPTLTPTTTSPVCVPTTPPTTTTGPTPTPTTTSPTPSPTTTTTPTTTPMSATPPTTTTGVPPTTTSTPPPSGCLTTTPTAG